MGSCLDEMCRLYGKFASYLRRVLCKTRLIFSRINGPINSYLVWLTTKTITTRNEQFQYSLIRLPDQPTCFLVSGLRQYGARRKRLEFQLVLWVSSSLHTLLARDHFLLNDFIKG